MPISILTWEMRSPTPVTGKALQSDSSRPSIITGRKLRRHPDKASLYYSLGLTLRNLRQLEAVVIAFQRAIALDPAPSVYRIKLHHALRQLGRYAEDERQLRAGLAREEDSPDLLAALAHSLIDQHRLDEAMACCRTALSVEPDYDEARMARSRTHFLAGRYRVAWPDRYCKVEGIDRRPKDATGRVWEGQDLDGKSILLYSEQGLGDVIQFGAIRATVGATRRGGIPLLSATSGPPPAAAPQGRPGSSRRTARAPGPTGSARSWDVPGVLGTDLDSILGECPYLLPVRRKNPVLPTTSQFRVGIVWGGNPMQDRDRQRSCRLEDFAPLFNIPGTEFVSFQAGPRVRELRSGWQGLVHDPGNALADLEATADALMEVDLVITVDTMLAHLAGALGRPVWTLLAFTPDWRWMLERTDTPWYPTMRMFRQPVPNDWASRLPRSPR